MRALRVVRIRDRSNNNVFNLAGQLTVEEVVVSADALEATDIDGSLIGNTYIFDNASIGAASNFRGASSDGRGNLILGGVAQEHVLYRNGTATAGRVWLGDGSDGFTWSGGTIAEAFFSGGDDVSVADGFIDTLTLKNLTLTRTGANLAGWENVIVDNSTLAFSDNGLETGSDAGTGLFIRNNGVVNGGSAFALTGNMMIEQSGAFLGRSNTVDTYSVSGNVSNAGSIRLNDGSAGDVFTVAGNYDGLNGTIFLDTVLDTDGAASDLLVVNGNTSGTTGLNFTNAGGAGAKTLADGIRVVQVGGISDGQFVIANPDARVNGRDVLVAGAFAYTLNQHGVADPADGDWYLRSNLTPTSPVGVPHKPLYQPGVPLYEHYPQHLLGMMSPANMQQRVGNRYWSEPSEIMAAEPVFCKDAEDYMCIPNAEQQGYYSDQGGVVTIEENGLWARVGGSYGGGKLVLQRLGVQQRGHEPGG